MPYTCVLCGKGITETLHYEWGGRGVEAEKYSSVCRRKGPRVRAAKQHFQLIWRLRKVNLFEVKALHNERSSEPGYLATGLPGFYCEQVTDLGKGSVTYALKRKPEQGTSAVQT